MESLVKPLKTASVIAAASLALAAGLAGAPAASWADSTASFEKSETVYGTLLEDGSVDALYVVNQFDVEKAGTIEDFGAYDRVSNLTDQTDIAVSGDKQTMRVSEGVFWYQGDIVRGALPWTFDVAYTLDGSEVSAAELAGATGRVGIRVHIAANPEVTDIFSQAYLLQVSLSAPADSCSNCAVSEGGTIVNAGSNRRVSFTVMPGQDADLAFEADVEDLEMSGLSISGALAAPDIEVGSFASADNGAVKGVLFSLTTPGIETPEVKTEVVEEPEKNFLERTMALFGL